MFDGLGGEVNWRRALGALVLACALAGGPAEAGKTSSARIRDRDELSYRVERLVCGRYHHGMPSDSVLALGKGALPVLANLLRDESMKHCWMNAAFAIGVFGETTYFDTLRTFVWAKRRSQIDLDQMQAIETAQGAIVRLAFLSERAYQYSINASNPAFWDSLPWGFLGVPDEVLHRDMARISGARIDHLRKVREERSRVRMSKTEIK